MLRTMVLLVGGLAFLCAASTQAQEAVLGQLYGSGVHAYFSGDYLKAYEKLTAAINAGSRDPRVYYFRGLVYLKLGRTPEADMDFQKAAERETKDVNKFYNVARALERVQGEARLHLESYRVEARMAALEEAEKVRKARYEAIQREEARVLREQTVEAAAAPAAGSAEVVPATTGEPSVSEPTADAVLEPFSSAKTEQQPIVAEGDSGTETSADKKAIGADENPFAPAAEKEEKPAAEEDPFAPSPAPPSDEKPSVSEVPGAEPKPSGGQGIFNAIGNALKKGAAESLGISKAGEKPEADSTDKPAAEKKSAEEDPFAATPTEQPSEKAAEPLADQDIPAEKPAGDEPAATEDPFAK